MVRDIEVRRELASTAAVDGGTLWRTEWTFGTQLVGAKPWAPTPARAIRDGNDEDRQYLGVLRRRHATAA